jgi:hypothetical protein
MFWKDETGQNKLNLLTLYFAHCRKCLIYNGAGEGNRTLVIIHAAKAANF